MTTEGQYSLSDNLLTKRMNGNLNRGILLSEFCFSNSESGYLGTHYISFNVRRAKFGLGLNQHDPSKVVMILETCFHENHYYVVASANMSLRLSLELKMTVLLIFQCSSSYTA